MNRIQLIAKKMCDICLSLYKIKLNVIYIYICHLPLCFLDIQINNLTTPYLILSLLFPTLLPPRVLRVYT